MEAYLKRESAEADEEFIAFLKRIGRYQPTERYNEAGIRNFTQLSGVWNEKIEPLKNSSFAGIVWYLGESSAFDFEFARFYLRAMKMLIKDLEGYFGKIPFVAVHISSEFYPYGDKYGYLYVNEAITALEEAFKDTVRTVPVYDIEPRWLKADGKAYYHPIHTVNKAPVAGRIARSLCGERSHYPKISAVEYSGSKAVCTISNVGPGLAKGEIFGFTLAGENGKYYSARAKAVSDDKIEVTSPDVTEAKCLTYAFMQYQDFCNARTTDGAPVLPFRSVAESVSKNYFFPPAYTADGALEVYENCFGWQTGICHKVPVWKNGEIYRSKKTEISRISTDDGIVLVFRAEPRAEDFFLFGVSPAICLSGHKNHLADFKYLNFEMKSDVESEFLGLILRSVNGENFRADLMNGDGKEYDSIPLKKEFSCFSVCLETGVRGDFAPINFSPDDRKRFVCAEFLFRSRKSVTVFLKGVELSDLNCSVESVVLNNECEKSGATQLPEASDRIAR